MFWYVELNERALKIIHGTLAPRVRIAQGRQGGEPLVVRSVELHGGQ